MEKKVINDKEYYVAYKGFKNDSLRNYQNNFTYKPNKLYKALDVDMSDNDCSYGLNLFQDIESCKWFFDDVCIIYECLVPVDDNKIKFIKEESKFRCLKFYMTDKVVWNTYSDSWIKDYDKHWNKLTEDQKNHICEYNPNIDIDKYWNELTKNQKDLICIHNSNIDTDKYWNELTKNQKDFICMYNPNINIDKYWNELTEYQKNWICAYNPNIDIDKYWNELTEDQKDLVQDSRIRNVVLEEEYIL